jgi:DNA-binding PucR family transcriptional regulator
MYDHHIQDMLSKLRPVLKDKEKAKSILERYWSDKIAIVWEVEDVFRAANEREVAMTKKEAIKLLQELHEHHNALKWEDLTTSIEDQVLGCKLTKRETKRFVERDIITVAK